MVISFFLVCVGCLRFGTGTVITSVQGLRVTFFCTYLFVVVGVESQLLVSPSEFS